MLDGLPRLVHRGAAHEAHGLDDAVHAVDAGLGQLPAVIKDIVSRGGEKISTAAVESCVAGLPQVAEVAGVALPDAVLGEVLAVAVRLHPGAALTAEQAQAPVPGPPGGIRRNSISVGSPGRSR